MSLPSPRKIKVLVIDDSALIRKVLSEIVALAPDMECVGAAPDPLIAREMIKRLNPDVLTLDVEMPRMDGLDFLEKLMRLRPTPVVMVSSLTQLGSETALRALELGAVDVMGKPRLSISEGLMADADEVHAKLRAAARARLQRRPAEGAAPAAPMAALRMPFTSSEKIIVVGSSTGGPEALRLFLERLPADAPGVLIAQHMPAAFTAPMARRLNDLCKVQVLEAQGGERVLPGHVYVAPGHSHLKLVRSGANYMTSLDQGEPVNRHRPSVDVLFDSAAQAAAQNAIGVILTGMGKDGAQGLLRMRQAGACTYAQDEATCVVFGMPREAIAIGAACDVAALTELPARIIQRLHSEGSMALRV